MHRLRRAPRRYRYVAAALAALAVIVVIVLYRHFTAAGPTLANVFNAGEVVPMPDGDVLVSDMGYLDHTGAQLLIVNRKGDVVWQYSGTLDLEHSAYPMPNGDILIADTGDDRVIEVNRQSKIVWNTDDLGGGHGKLGQGRLSDGTTLDYPNDAKLLPNGDIMISLRLQNRVVVITRSGRIVKDITGFLHRQHNPDPLPNGDTLIADSDANRVIEVDRSGRHIVWQYSNGLSWPRDANLLPNGDILIADSNNNRLIEITRSGHTVREWDGIPHVYSAASLPNGDVLVGDSSTYGVAELTPSNKVVWTSNHQPQAPWQPPTQIQNGGFEQAASGSQAPLDWDPNDALAYSIPPGKRADMTLDSKVHHGGKFSGKISYQGDSNSLFYSQTVGVTPGHRYRFSGWIKTDNVRACYPCAYGAGSTPGHTAEFELAFYTQTGAPPSAPALPTHSGTSGWINDTVDFVVPSGVTSMGINPTLRGQGTVWFDDVSLTDLGT